MATLIITLIFGLLIAFFATQNTSTASLYFLNYSLPNIPIYMVVVGSLLAGFFISWIISLVNEVGTDLTIRGKESKIKDFRKENAELVKDIHKLELENTKLRAHTNAVEDDKSL